LVARCAELVELDMLKEDISMGLGSCRCHTSGADDDPASSASIAEKQNPHL
jgi:hypothetical protein